ncbi:MAG: hypothetical protein MUP55_04275, partial [Candidatus Aenigmarchaeota archaeon]|nr:hypothetical protein [Candidatus Aenigmarchaeota archaeon]
MKIVQADAGSESHKEYSGSWFSAYFGKAYKGIKSLLNRNGGSQDNPMNENTRKICDVLTFEQELGIFGLDPKSIRSRIGELSLERPEIAEKYINLKKEAGFNIVKDFPLAIPSDRGNGHAIEKDILLPADLSEYAALG